MRENFSRSRHYNIRGVHDEVPLESIRSVSEPPQGTIQLDEECTLLTDEYMSIVGDSLSADNQQIFRKHLGSMFRAQRYERVLLSQEILEYSRSRDCRDLKDVVQSLKEHLFHLLLKAIVGVAFLLVLLFVMEVTIIVIMTGSSQSSGPPSPMPSAAPSGPFPSADLESSGSILKFPASTGFENDDATTLSPRFESETRKSDKYIPSRFPVKETKQIPWIPDFDYPEEKKMDPVEPFYYI